MKINRWAVGIATVAILATSGAVTAFAAAPPYDPDPNAYGTVIFYDAAGNVITSGDGAVPESPKFAVSSADPVTAITNKRANLSLYGPQPLVDPGLWGGVQLNTNTVYPLLPTLTTPATTIPAVVASSTHPATMQLASSNTFFVASKTFVANPAASGLQNVFQVRLKNVQVTDYAATSITVDPVTGAWQQIYPVPAPSTTTTTTAPPATTTTTTAPPVTTTTTTAPPVTTTTTLPPTTTTTTEPPATETTTTTTPPTTTGPAADAVQATLDGTVLSANPTLAPGDTVTLEARGFAPDEQVDVALDATSIATATAAADGSVSYIFMVPASQPSGAAAVTLSGAAPVTLSGAAAPVMLSAAAAPVMLSAAVAPAALLGAAVTRTFDFTVAAAGTLTTADPGTGTISSIADSSLTSGTSGSLPFTGFEALPLAGGALLLLLLGAGGVLAARRMKSMGGKYV